MSAWATSMPYMFAWRNYVRYGCARHNYCDSRDRVARASRVKQVSQRQDLAHSQSSWACRASSCTHDIVTGVAKIEQPNRR